MLEIKIRVKENDFVGINLILIYYHYNKFTREYFQ